MIRAPRLKTFRLKLDTILQWKNTQWYASFFFLQKFSVFHLVSSNIPKSKPAINSLRSPETQRSPKYWLCCHTTLTTRLTCNVCAVSARSHACMAGIVQGAPVCSGRAPQGQHWRLAGSTEASSCRSLCQSGGTYQIELGLHSYATTLTDPSSRTCTRAVLDSQPK